MVKDELEQIFKQVFEKLNYDTSNINVIKSNRKELCDFQFDGVFKLAKKLQKTPKEIGNKIVDEINNIDNFNDYFDKVEFCNPGFINITLSNKFINKHLKLMNDNYKFNIKIPKKEKYVIDYGGYNIAKPLHIGHLRPSIIGESIKRILKYLDQSVIADVHLGDYGLQIGEVIYGILKDNKDISDIDINYLNEIYPKISSLCKENEEVLKQCQEITKQLQEGDVKYHKFFDKIMEVSIEDIKKITNYFDISFDLWEGESDAYKYLSDLENYLNSKKVLQESDGALIIDVKKEDDNKPMPPLLFKKSNGAYLYDSTDLATIYERKQKFNPDKIIYVTDFRQNLHFEQCFRASDKAGLIPYTSFTHAYNGTINGTDGKPFKTREGSAPKLKELIEMVKETFINLKETNKDMPKKDLDIIVNSIIKFADLQNSREKDYIFDIEKFSGVEGKTGPYILYSYVRINKILNNYKESSDKISNNIYNKEDRDLRIYLLFLNDAINDAYENKMPSYIANYIYNLCVLLNIFYGQNHIANLNDEEKQSDWLYILNLTNKVIKEMLNLLMIDVPSAM